MKTLHSASVSSFGGLNFVIEEILRMKVDRLVNGALPPMGSQSRYSWFDIFMSYWSVFFCGGDCAEDLSINMKSGLEKNPFINIPSPDRVLSRIKSLADVPQSFGSERGGREHRFSLADKMNRLNLQLLSLLPCFEKQGVVLDYDNTLIFNEKSDAEFTYKKAKGYCPGVGMIGRHIVYVENRNGSSSPHVLQHETFDRMRNLLMEFGISVAAIRADSASYTHDIIKSMENFSSLIYVRARMTEALERSVASITEWKEVPAATELLRGSTVFTPFARHARGNRAQSESLKEYRIVVTKEKRKDGQINLFTGEACNYSVILTNDFEKSDDEVVVFYNARGGEEREFDEVKNDFGWNKLPFSKLEENTVFLILMAMCKNLYVHLIQKFSEKIKCLSPNFRIKKFIFRFICVPAKWVESGRVKRLRIYSSRFG